MLIGGVFGCFFLKLLTKCRVRTRRVSTRKENPGSPTVKLSEMWSENIQESPPAWTQETYRLPCSEYSFCYPTSVPPLLVQRGVPYLGTPPAGYPPGRVPPILTWGTLPGYPPRQGTPVLTWLGGTLPGYPFRQGTPWSDLVGSPWQGTPPSWLGRVPPPPSWTWLGTPRRCLPHGILRNVAKHYGIWVPPLRCLPMAFWVMLQSIMGYGYPPPSRCGQTNKVKLLPSRRTTYAGGKNSHLIKTRQPTDWSLIGSCVSLSVSDVYPDAGSGSELRHDYLGNHLLDSSAVAVLFDAVHLGA